MQSPADPGLPHTRARAVHWLATAAAVAAVAAVAALVQPEGATARPGDPLPQATGGPDPRTVDYPLECGPHGAAVTHSAQVDLDGDGRTETVAAVRCDAGGGTPPHGLYLLTARADGAVAVAETLVDPAEGMIVEELTAGDGELRAVLLAYSSPDVPRSHPDLHGEATWNWRDGRLVVDQAAPPAPPFPT
ncbi:hypothetical protein [Streptomyces bohaiensis]|uniref:Secreted protein n=1 Tax=Streptomyces bohaiensis TaxID=1431344 RepID=A0ABX1C8W7_9ACTN|nr:hypothetical protein [Streptomyces bohaiensis]NJQ14681.1 hypothetical protein [Streptomyces bohaiensis]